MPTKARRWVLASRPQGKPTLDNFRLEDVTLPDPGEHELLIRTEYHSVDPGMRSRLSGASYAAALPLGDTVDSAMIGIVEKSNNDKFRTGDRVTGGFRWVSHALSNGRGIAGSREKCDYLKSLGFDRTIDYRETADLRSTIAETCPGGIDIYFDNEGELSPQKMIVTPGLIRGPSLRHDGKKMDAGSSPA